jgi:hypothetical protein
MGPAALVAQALRAKEAASGLADFGQVGLEQADLEHSPLHQEQAAPSVLNCQP